VCVCVCVCVCVRVCVLRRARVCAYMCVKRVWLYAAKTHRLWHVPVYCSALQSVAVHCSVSQCAAALLLTDAGALIGKRWWATYRRARVVRQRLPGGKGGGGCNEDWAGG